MSIPRSTTRRAHECLTVIAVVLFATSCGTTGGGAAEGSDGGTGGAGDTSTTASTAATETEGSTGGSSAGSVTTGDSGTTGGLGCPDVGGSTGGGGGVPNSDPCEPPAKDPDASFTVTVNWMENCNDQGFPCPRNAMCSVAEVLDTALHLDCVDAIAPGGESVVVGLSGPFDVPQLSVGDLVSLDYRERNGSLGEGYVTDNLLRLSDCSGVILVRSDQGSEESGCGAEDVTAQDLAAFSAVVPEQCPDAVGRSGIEFVWGGESTRVYDGQHKDLGTDYRVIVKQATRDETSCRYSSLVVRL